VIVVVLALRVAIFNPSQGLTDPSAFAEPKAFEEQLKSCSENLGNVVACLNFVSTSPSLSTSPSSESSEPAEVDESTEPEAEEIDIVAQGDLLAFCIDNECSPVIHFSDREYYQRPFRTLTCNDALLELKPEFHSVYEIQLLAEEIAQTGTKVLHVIDLPNYKAITVEKSTTNQVLLDPVSGDNRFLATPEIPCEEYVLQIDPGFMLSATGSQAIASLEGDDVVLVAGEAAKMPGVYLVDYYSFGDFKAVTVRTDENNPILNDGRFVKYDGIGNYTGRGQPTPISGHISQVEWGQTLPNGFKRTVPIDAMQEGDEIPASSPQPAVDADIAILDTGVSLSHPDLNVYRNISFVDGVASGDDDVGHGSHVAGVAAAKDNEIGVVGIAPGARIWAIKVCDQFGECKISDQIKGIEYATKHADEIDVLNISIENPNSPALNNAVAEAVKAGITVVASSGNYGIDASSTSPANSAYVLAVSAIGDSDGICGGSGPELEESGGIVSDDTFAFFSNYGPVVKIAAPGVQVLSTYNGTDYGVESGTSMAAPHVAGAATLYKSEFPDASPAEVIANITASGTLPDSLCNEGPEGYFEGDVDGVSEPLLLREFRPS
jgi:subtilisin family serine protease